MNQIYHQIHLFFWTNNQANIESYKKTNFINCQKAQPAPHPLRPGTTTSICCCWQRATSRQRYRRSNRDVRGRLAAGVNRYHTKDLDRGVAGGWIGFVWMTAMVVAWSNPLKTKTRTTRRVTITLNSNLGRFVGGMLQVNYEKVCEGVWRTRR